MHPIRKTPHFSTHFQSRRTIQFHTVQLLSAT